MVLLLLFFVHFKAFSYMLHVQSSFHAYYYNHLFGVLKTVNCSTLGLIS